MYLFVNFSRTFLVVLAIATELNAHFDLKCGPDVAYLWTIICEFVAEGKEMYDQRYASLCH